MDLSNMTLVQLREEAKNRGLKKISSLKKQELLELLEGKVQSASDDKTVTAEETVTDNKTVTAEETVAEKQPERRRQDRRRSDRRQNDRRRQVRRTNSNSKQNKEKDNSDITTEKDNSDIAREKDNSLSAKEKDNAIIIEESKKTAEENKSEAREKLIQAEDSSQTDVSNEEITEERVSAPDNKSKATGILEITENGYGFLRGDNYLTTDKDVYVSHSQIRKFNLKTGDMICGNTKFNSPNDKFAALTFIESVNGYKPYDAQRRPRFEDLTPIFPDHRIQLEIPNGPVSMRMLDFFAPIGKGQRGMIVSQPKTGKTTLLKQVAQSIIVNEPEMKVIILLIDERPEEVTDIKESIEGKNAEVIYSTFDEQPSHHEKVAEMVLERAKRLVEHGEDVVILLDSITRLARAYNLTENTSGRTLSGGLDPNALYMPKKFFGAARNMREGGSLTILATALVDTGSKMDDVVFEEFKGTGNMELVLERRLAERRIFPAINILKSGTRREDLLLTKEEQEVSYRLHREFTGVRGDERFNDIIGVFKKSRTNEEFINVFKNSK